LILDVNMYKLLHDGIVFPCVACHFSTCAGNCYTIPSFPREDEFV
jgi:hypothetical protein